MKFKMKFVSMFWRKAEAMLGGRIKYATKMRIYHRIEDRVVQGYLNRLGDMK